MCAPGLLVGAQARLMSQALRKIAGNASKCNCTVLFLNQLRHKVAAQQHGKLQVPAPVADGAVILGMH